MNAFATDGTSLLTSMPQAHLCLSLDLNNHALALSQDLSRLLDTEIPDLEAFYAHLQPDSAQALRQALDAFSQTAEAHHDHEQRELLLSFSKLQPEDYSCLLQPLFSAGKPVLVQARLQPVPELDEARQRELEALRFEAVYERSFIAIVITDGLGRVLECNPAFSKLMKTSRAALVGKNFREFTHPEDLRRELPMLERLIQGDSDTYQIEKRYLIPDGRQLWADLSLTVLRDPAGQSTHLIGFIHDISERKRLEAELAKLTATAEPRARQELFNLLAHDVRNALSSIAGFAQLLKRRELLSEAAAPMVERMRQAAANAHELLQEMLFAYELTDTAAHPEQLRDCLDETLRWFTIQAREKDVSLNTVLPAVFPLPAIPPVWLERLLRHLLDNALKFTPPGGQISLSLEDSGPERLRFILSDTGLGIPAERQARIFAKTAARDDQGGGLGLYLVQQIVQQYGGSVWFESREGQGSTFYLELPVQSP